MKMRLSYLLTGVLLMSAVFLSSCGDDDVPAPENPEEEITRVTLTFTPSAGGTAVTAVWFDADGEDGPDEATVEPINLEANTAYTLSLTLENTLATEQEEQDVTAEIKTEDDEHMFFFSFTADVFASPAGDGNIGADSRNDPMNYEDNDGSNPLGLETSWTTGDAASAAAFKVLLKHQPPLEEGGTPQKSATSTSQTGDTDIDIDFVLNIQ
ncbi:MAG: hypothetical protein ABJG47_15515 [Ekhidna sp.]